jgi:type I restriction enzyme, S subunit
MSPEELLANFGEIAEARDGVKKLRGLILEWAVRGQLVPQDSAEEPALRLLKRLQGNFERKPTNVRATSGEPLIQTAALDFPYDLPATWQWVRLSEVATIDSCLVNPSNYSDWPHIAPDNIEKGTGRLLSYRTIQEDGVTSSKHKFSAGHILYSKIRPNLSKIVIVGFDGLCSADMYPISSGINARYLQAFMLSGAFLDQVTQEDNRLAMPKVNQQQLSATLVPVPPLTEQKRIVAKVDQLMALCDELEARQTRKRETGKKLTRSALEALTSAEGPEEFAAAWRRVADNFEVLFDRAEDVVELRRAILGLALHGSLSHQQHDGESVDALLKRISQERNEVRARSGRASAGASRPDENLHAIPQSWRWIPVGEIADCVLGKMLDKNKHTRGTPRPYLRNINVRWSAFDLTDLLSMYFEDDELERYGVLEEDVLICEGGEPGRAAVWRDASTPMLIQKAIHRVRLHGGIVPEWLVMNLRYDAWTERLGNYFTGATIKHFTGQSLAQYSIRLPPVAEQKRIVAKVDQLMALCDDLESKLRSQEQSAERLAEAMTAAMVA